MALKKVEFDFREKIVLITGGSRGLGRAMAFGFAAAGAVVAVVGRKLESCQATVDEIVRDGGKAVPFACHVGRWAEIDTLVAAVYARFGKIDVLVNNAGKSPLYDTPAGITEELYDSTLNVNLKGTFRLCALVGQRMYDGDGGAIINISSGAAVRPRKNVIPYAAAKAAVNALTEAFADAYGPKVRVNCIMPGPFFTDVSQAWDQNAFKARAEQTIALRRGGQPDEIVGAALYLASPHASFTTGAILKIDGGSR